MNDDERPPPPPVLRSRSRADRLACVGGDDDDADRQLGYSARRSFTRAGRRTPARDDDGGGAAAFPGYMASTASAKAKFRSMSTPKERSGAGAADAYSEQCFPFADRLLSPIPSMSPIPSIASDIVFARSSRPAGAHDADEVPVPEVAGTPQLRLRGRAAPAADGAVHPYPVKRISIIKHVICNER
jgi:hypothetical protein